MYKCIGFTIMAVSVLFVSKRKKYAPIFNFKGRCK